MTARPLAVGIDLGGTQIKGVCVDCAGAVIEKRLRATPYDGDPSLFAEAVRSLVEELGPGLPIGLSAPGLARADRRAIVGSRAASRPGESRLDRTSRSFATRAGFE